MFKRKLKKILGTLLVVLISISLIGCLPSSNNDDNWNNGSGGSGSIILTSFRVNFYIDGSLKYYMTVTDSQIFTPPEIPSKKNFKILGWYYSNGEKADFTEPHKTQTDFYAKYEPDYAALINEVTKNVVSANVKITKTSYNKNFLGFKKDQITHTGSGIIFHNSDGYYYILTNAHVTEKYSGRDYADYIVHDYKGNEYKAYVYSGSEQSRYDLSTMYIKQTNQTLNVIKRAKVNPILKDEVIAVGQPDGQNNAITFGEVTKYEKITTTNGFTTFFDAMIHSAPTFGGSSGGAILDLNFNLVGLHFAGSRDSNNNFIRGIAIPIEIINEYLYKYVYN